MFDIQMDEPDKDFRECWIAAAQHLHKQVDGGIQGWLKVEPQPPFLEHLSFRLGNQLFFIRIVDPENQLEIPGTHQGLLSVSEGCNGNACLMPMEKVAGEWRPVHVGWGLLKLPEENPFNPVDLVSDEKIIISDWELQDFAVQIVRNELESKGFKIMSWNGNPKVNPSVWYVGDNGPEWVIVKGVRYPDQDAQPPEDIDAIASRCATVSEIGNFASVTLANGEDPFDPDAATNGNFLPIYRGYGATVRYQGLQKLDL